MSLQMIDNVNAWVGGVPASWSVVALKHVVSKLNRSLRPDDKVVVCTNKGSVIPRGDNSSGLVSLTENGYQGVLCGDLLVHGMDTWHGAIAVADISGKCTSVVHVCDSAQDKRFIAYYLRALAFRGVYKAFSNGVRQNTSDFRSWKKAGEIPIILPPLEEQRRIANYLDAKCAEIDRAIKAAEDSIEEYKDYREALISRAIRTGLRGKEQLTECDCKIIRNIPVGWGLVRINRIATLHNGDRGREYPSGIDIVPDGIPFITSAELGDNRIARRCAKHITRRKYDCLKGVKLRKGDVVFCLRGSVGKCSLNDFYDEGTIASSLTVARTRDCFSEWLCYALGSEPIVHQAIMTAIGATSANLAANILGQARCPLPPFEEQREIVSFLDSKCSEVSSVISSKQSIIEDLKAYKQSLIYETVTGKREV